MRALAYKSFLVFSGLMLVLAVIAMLLDWEPEDAQMFDPSDLAKMQIGDVVRLRDLLKESAEKVCFLSPYQDRLKKEELLSRQVNAHLDAIGLRLEDGGFALVFVKGDKVSVQRPGRGLNPIATWHPWNQEISRIFMPFGCTTIDRALVIKSSSGHLLFGERR